MSGRIRWEPACRGSDNLDGYIAGVAAPVFRISWAYDPGPGAAWTLDTTIAYPFMLASGKHAWAATADELKPQAEKWLAEFVASLGAEFPAEGAKR